MKHFVLVWILTLTQTVLAQYEPAQSVQIDHPIQSIWPGAYYLVDEDNAYQATDILANPPFHLQSSTTPPNLGFIKGQVWVWFQLDNLASSLFTLQISFAHIKTAKIYLFTEDLTLYQSIENFVDSPFISQHLPSPFPTIELAGIKPHSVVMLQMSSDHGLRLPINIGSDQSLQQNQLARLAIIFISIGILLALFVYNLILFASTQQLYYLYYCLNLGFLQVFFLIDLGFSRLYFPASHWLNYPQAWAITVCLAFVCAILFAQSFLRLSELHPKWNKWFYGLVLAVVANIILVLLASNETAINFYLLVSGIYQISIFAVSIYALMQGYKPARFFLLAWVFLAIGGFIYQLTIVGGVEINLFTEHAFLLGTVIEAILLSLALADLIKKLQQDQIDKDKQYQVILNKTSQRLSSALNAAEKHKKVRDVFLKLISHELKTPLHSIQHVLELSLQGYNASSELLHDANHSTRLISRHIDKLLMNTELSASEPEFEQEKVEVKTMLKNWNDDFYTQCSNHKTEFSLVSNLVDWDELTGPVRPIYLVLTELVYNLVHLDINSLLLSIDIDEESHHLVIQLDMHNASTFPVIGKEALFQNANDLSFVNQVLGLLEGDWHFSADHPAMIIEIMIPNVFVERKEAGDLLPESVLVIEDNEINQKVMASMLTRMGVKFDIAVNGQDGLKLQQRHPAPVILMDCQMPVMDGFDTTLNIRKDVQRYGRPIIIAVSANSMELDKTRCISVGMDDFIAKPVRMEDLRSSLLRWGQHR